MNHKHFFGSDGIRGKVGQEPITEGFMRRLGWVAGQVFKNLRNGQKQPKRILVGQDTRDSGAMIVNALAEGLTAAGCDVCLGGILPTPAVAWLLKTDNSYIGGIVVTASHNLASDNGVKFFMADGGKLNSAAESDIDSQLHQPINLPHRSPGRIIELDDCAERYIGFCQSTLPPEINLTGLHVVLDCANGAAWQIAPAVFRALGAKVDCLSIQPDGRNINKDCGVMDTTSLIHNMAQTQADLGIALDGDGDRVLLVDKQGRALDGDDLLFMIASDRRQRGTLQGGIAGTIMTNTGLEQALKKMQIPFQRTPVGDNHVLAQLKANNWLVGGENSGHILCLDLSPSCDAIVTGLHAIAIWIRSGLSLPECYQGWERYPYELINLPYTAFAFSNKPITDELNAIVHTIKSRLGENNRIIARPSGTEPMVRVLIEAQSQKHIDDCRAELITYIGNLKWADKSLP